MAGDDGTTPAPEGQVWVCTACGKTSRTRYGFDADNKRVSQMGYDESCMLHAVLCCERGPLDIAYKAVEEVANGD